MKTTNLAQKYKIEFESLPWNQVSNGLRFKIHFQNKKQFRLVEFSKKFVELDWCPKAHMGYVLEGELEINFNGNILHFKQGDGLFIPAGKAHRHKAKALTDTAKLFLIEEIEK